ncbi:MAG: hypothetical protein O7F12_14395 [Nitrospirae bacterium]|nr:hypothetical protein [Nitrospirota bacterium]
MLSGKRLTDLENETFLLGRRWTNRYLNNENHPPKQEIEHEMVSLALINQELTAEIKRLRERLAESEEARQCSMLTVTHLESQCRELEVDLLLAQSRVNFQTS